MAKVVIIGGGQAGFTVAKELDGKVDLTLIEKNCVYHNNMVSLRGLVDIDCRWQQFQPYSGLLRANTSRRVQGEAVDIDATSVKLKDGQSINYDYLIIATGSQNPFPARIEGSLNSVLDGLKRYDDMEEVLLRSQRIVVVGGGSVGIELASEVKSAFPSKEVTLLHRGKTLMSNQGGAPPLDPEFSNGLLDILQKLNIQVVLNDSIERGSGYAKGYEEGTHTLKTAQGREIQCDLLFWCTGNTPNTAFAKSHLGSALNAHGLINVNSHLQVEGHPNVFAIGDINAIAEPKLAFVAGSMHAPIAAKNVLSLIKNPSKPLPGTHKPFQSTAFMAIGPDYGLAQVGFLPWPLRGVHTRGFFANLKNGQKLFVGKSWKAVTNQSLPATNPYRTDKKSVRDTKAKRKSAVDWRAVVTVGLLGVAGAVLYTRQSNLLASK